MRKHSCLIAALAVCMTGMVASPSHGQPFPERPIRVVVPFPAGGGADVLGRMLSHQLTGLVNVQVVVENRAGAGGTIGTDFVARAAPDGYTMVFASSSSMSINPHIGAKPRYDALKDFSPIILVAKAPNLMVVHPSLPATSVKGLIALAKSRPGELNFASNGVGTLSHLTAELFMLRTGTRMVHVSYKGAAPATVDTVAGQTSLLFAAFPSVSTQVRAGKLRALGVTSARRVPAAPEVPAVAETLPGFEANQWWGMFGPAGIPNNIVKKLNADLATVLRHEEIKRRFAAVAAEIAGGAPRDLAEFLKVDFAKWGKVVKAAGINKR